MNEKKKEKFVMDPADKTAMKEMLIVSALATCVICFVSISLLIAQYKTIGKEINNVYAIIIVFLINLILDYVFLILPCIVFRYRIYKRPCEHIITVVVIFAVVIVYMVPRYLIDVSLGGDGSDLTPGWIFMILQGEILKKKTNYEKISKPADEELTLWAEIMDNLPPNLVWAEICNTDFGNLLERLHEKNKDTKEIKRDAVYITLSAALNTLKHKCNDNKQYNNEPQDSQLLSFADKQIKKAQKLQWLDDETVQKLSKALNYYQTKLKAKSTDL